MSKDYKTPRSDRQPGWLGIIEDDINPDPYDAVPEEIVDFIHGVDFDRQILERENGREMAVLVVDGNQRYGCTPFDLHAN